MTHKAINKVLFISLLGVIASLPCRAQDADKEVTVAKVYTLEQCVNEAVSNNLKLRSADRQILMSGEQRKEAHTKYFPTVSAMGLGYMADKGLVQMDMGGGMALSLLKHGYTASVTAMQPVFAGGQIVNGNKLAKVGEDVSRLQRGLTENEVRLNTENYYWQAVMLKEKLKTIDHVEKQLAEVKKDAQAAVDAGIKNRNDLLQVQLRHNEMRTTRIQVENALQTVYDLLAQVMGHPGESISVTDMLSTFVGCALDSAGTASVDISADLRQLFIAPDEALLQTREYQLLDKQVEANKLQYELSVGKNLPSVAVGGGYVYNHLMDKSQNNLVGMLTVSVPISGWWGGSHDMKRQKLQVANAIDDKQDKSQQLIIRMRKAWNDLGDAYKQVAIARQSIEQSEENLRLNTDYYQAGTSTISDVLDAQTLYQQSRDQYVESVATYQIKKREYLQATGR